jgi:hypothetical protein
MIATMLLSTLLVTQAQPAPQVPALQPKLNVRFQLPPANVLAARRALEQREIVCGMVVVRKSADDDPKIILPARETGAVIRRIEPQPCGATKIAPSK